MMATASTVCKGARPFAGTKVAAAKNGSRVAMKAGNWLPGSTTPAYLENLPASYGFGEWMLHILSERTFCLLCLVVWPIVS